YLCKYCEKSFAHRPNLSRHISEKHKLLRYFCPFCDTSFIRKTHLTKHIPSCPSKMKKRDDDLPYGCKICEKKFTFQTSLRRHIREKHLNIRFICPHCGMTFTQKVSLFNHVEYRCKGPNPVTFMEKKKNVEMEDEG
ncbi:hypothetical protein LOTGIDRAFT_117494, partial [Lottia gigantea]